MIYLDFLIDLFWFLPVVLEGLDVESEGGRDGVDVLAVELLQDRRLARVVQPAEIRKSNIVLSGSAVGPRCRLMNVF